MILYIKFFYIFNKKFINNDKNKKKIYNVQNI